MNNDTSGRDRLVYSEPGEEFHYSGVGFEYLRYVLENITGTPFDAYTEKSVLPIVPVSLRLGLRDLRQIYHR